MEETLKRFAEQFSWEPPIGNGEKLRSYSTYALCGMGGSHLGAWLLKRYGKVANLTIHRDYGLPELPTWEDTLVILSSYSGSTEEVLDAARIAKERGLPMAAISTGGPLLAFAKEEGIPYIQIPDTGLEPRMAIGFSMVGVAALIQRPDLMDAVRTGGKSVDPFVYRERGKALAEALTDRIPVIYASAANTPLAYLWKIKLNETAKIPAFANVFPELCHNEFCGLDVAVSTKQLSSGMRFLFLRDPEDHPRIQKRMDVAEELLKERGMESTRIDIDGTGFGKAFASAFLSDWTAFTLASAYGVPDLPTPLIDEFKKRILD